MLPSIIVKPNLSLSKNTSDSDSPTQFIDALTAFAIYNIKPIDPPNSGPSDLDI